MLDDVAELVSEQPLARGRIRRVFAGAEEHVRALGECVGPEGVTQQRCLRTRMDSHARKICGELRLEGGPHVRSQRLTSAATARPRF